MNHSCESAQKDSPSSTYSLAQTPILFWSEDFLRNNREFGGGDREGSGTMCRYMLGTQKAEGTDDNKEICLWYKESGGLLKIGRIYIFRVINKLVSALDWDLKKIN